jgi:hypothetical protein
MHPNLLELVILERMFKLASRSPPRTILTRWQVPRMRLSYLATRSLKTPITNRHHSSDCRLIDRCVPGLGSITTSRCLQAGVKQHPLANVTVELHCTTMTDLPIYSKALSRCRRTSRECSTEVHGTAAAVLRVAQFGSPHIQFLPNFTKELGGEVKSRLSTRTAARVSRTARTRLAR